VLGSGVIQIQNAILQNMKKKKRKKIKDGNDRGNIINRILLHISAWINKLNVRSMGRLIYIQGTERKKEIGLILL
jgi:hypothetical protein